MSTATQSKSAGPPAILNLPNQLTLSRFVLSVVLFILIALDDFAGRWLLCLAVFAVAAITDWLDGFLARRQGITSTLGRNLDPLVDKILICGAYIFLIPVVESGLRPWMVAVVVSRELLVTSLRGFMESSGAKFGADWGGKVKMVLQCATLIVIFLVEASRGNGAWEWLPIVRDVVIYVMVLSTVQSGLGYLWKAATLLRQEN